LPEDSGNEARNNQGYSDEQDSSGGHRNIAGNAVGRGNDFDFRRYGLVAALGFCVLTDVGSALLMREISLKVGREMLIIAIFVILGVPCGVARFELVTMSL